MQLDASCCCCCLGGSCSPEIELDHTPADSGLEGIDTSHAAIPSAADGVRGVPSRLHHRTTNREIMQRFVMHALSEVTEPRESTSTTTTKATDTHRNQLSLAESAQPDTSLDRRAWHQVLRQHRYDIARLVEVPTRKSTGTYVALTHRVHKRQPNLLLAAVGLAS